MVTFIPAVTQVMDDLMDQPANDRCMLRLLWVSTARGGRGGRPRQRPHDTQHERSWQRVRRAHRGGRC